jgi:phage tail-like protein
MIDLFYEPHATARFEVWIEGIFLAVFTECTLPSLSVQTEPLTEGGQNTYIHKLYKGVDAGTLKLKSGMSRGGEMLRWYMLVQNGEIELATRQLLVVVYDVASAPMALWYFQDAYPVRWNGPSLNATTSALAVEEIELAHRGFRAL